MVYGLGPMSHWVVRSRVKGVVAHLGGQMVLGKGQLVNHFEGQRNEPKIFQGWAKDGPNLGQEMAKDQGQRVGQT